MVNLYKTLMFILAQTKYIIPLCPSLAYSLRIKSTVIYSPVCFSMGGSLQYDQCNLWVTHNMLKKSFNYRQ